jgi:Tfp pilus assembly protein PilF
MWGGTVTDVGAAFRRPILIVLAIIAVIVGGFLYRRGAALPQPGSEQYEQVTRAFYHGLAALQVGLLDDSRAEFTKATELVPQEPASWANLALAQLRLGELEAAAAPIERALALAPDHSDIVLLAGRMASARGQLDEGIALLRRAALLDATGVRARAALAEELERAGGAENEDEALRVLDELLERAPDHVSVIVERARIAARRGDFARLNESLMRLAPIARSWPPVAREQFENLQRAAAAGSSDDSARASSLLRNVLARVPTFIESLTALRTPAELVAEPIARFLVMVPPPATPSPPDTSLTYQREPAGDRGPGAGALSLDWNHDFLPDLVTTGDGVRLLLQGPEGTFADRTPTGPRLDAFAAWAADVEMDGDLDLVVGLRDGDPIVLRNNGDGTWRSISPFPGVGGARGFGWADLDQDADPDAVFLDMAGTLHVFANRQAGDFTRTAVAGASAVRAIAVADVDADGLFDIVALESTGALKGLSRRGNGWDAVDLATWPGLIDAAPGSHRLLVADLDNNGGVDLVAAGGGGSRVWLSDASHRLQPLPATPAAEVFSVEDLNGDGLLDLTGTAAGMPVRLTARGTAGYHWKVVRPRAQQNAGDQRINSFGIGGEIEVRSGLLVQKQLLNGPLVHVGLGAQTTIDVTRIVWPNGVPQAEFGASVDDVVVAEQRLKGSCPWVFAWDGSGLQFVTDFLWRSPLGLRINAQDTAGVVQTEDWVRIGGDQLVAKDNAYDVRITAELWETHFFDHVSLMVVDHPEDTEVYVDERFSAASPPALAIHSVRGVTPVSRAWDESGRDVTDVIARRDGRYLATFERGRYQGVAQEHFVEFDAPAVSSQHWLVGARRAPTLAEAGQAAPVLLAHGWIYPTDSSINVAIGQGGDVRPAGLSLEAQGADGTWVVVNPDLGFPAGKNKTILIDLGPAAGARRLRLRTNLEIYWDALAYATPAGGPPPAITRLPASAADLRYRGFSATSSKRGESPETPDYGRIESRSQRWRDLVGYHTRFGDVRELLTQVDDRYVIMNAGDELLLRFPEQPAPVAGSRRVFVLVGDGWEKDGDFNTGHSQTVLPLPSHDRPDYGRGEVSLELEDDPVYRRHRQDWERYHTRYVTPRAFVRGLR